MNTANQQIKVRLLLPGFFMLPADVAKPVDLVAQGTGYRYQSLIVSRSIFWSDRLIVFE